MKDWKKTLISRQLTLRDALVAINESTSQIAMVVDEHGRLLGTLTDGDARRGLLRGLTLSDHVSEVMHINPICARVTDSRQAMIGLMREKGLHQIPLVDENGIVMGLEIVDDILHVPDRPEWVIVMAGGLGTRLKDLTRETPKPMLRVGSRPILETIIRCFAEQGFRRFYLAVNYKAEKIETHFGDGSKFGIDVRYLREERRMGTAGALSLLPELPEQPFIVTNADLLTKEDYSLMVDNHVAVAADATMGVRRYEMQVPFGVVREDDGFISAIEEKPVHSFVVSAGMYVLSPRMLELIPKNTFFDMPSLFSAAIAAGYQTRCHYVDGYWLDIGRPADFEQANIDFHEVFK
jgi:dTDP-glucose pyrophosphorylase